MLPRKIAWLAVFGASACAAGPSYYSGRVEERRAEPEALLDVAASGADGQYVRLGSVRASCTSRSGFQALDGERLSDLDCSRPRLDWVLRESAAAAGGEALVAERCMERGHGARRQLECHADVARLARANNERSPLAIPRTRAPELPAPSPRDVQRIDEPDATLAARILLDFSPRVSSYQGEPRAASAVRELVYRPVWDVPLGDLRAHCDGDCSEYALRHALLVAAGRLGAPDVVGVHCARLAGDAQCIGELAAPEAGADDR